MSTTTTTESILQREAEHTSGVWPQREIALSRGQGARVFDTESRSYIDCTAGHGVANVGHAHPRIAQAIADQAAQLLTCAQTFPNERRAEFYERLAAVTPPGIDRFFLCNSGTEAVEGALKFARVATGRHGFVAFRRGFHGRTFGSLSATWDRKHSEPFEPLVPGFQHVTYNDLEAARAAVSTETACVILELVQGEGGVHPADAEFVAGLRELCDTTGSLLVVDEIQTGFGRTGRMFACEHYDLAPDVLCLGKAIGGGMPMGAIGLGARVGELPTGCHGSTFGGNPLACAAAFATLEVIAHENLVARSAELGAVALERLGALDLPSIRAVRGRGLMIGIELKQRVAPILRALQSRGVLALPAGATVLRLLPPLVITDDELDQALETIESTLGELG